MAYYEFTFLKLLIGFCVLIAHLNITGKTQLSQMTPIDFIGNFVLGGIIGGVIYSDTIPLQQYVILLLLGVLLISALNFASKHISMIRTITIGDPIPIMKNGNFILDNILKSRNKLDIVSLTSQLHSMGINSFEEVRYAQVEPGGQLSVITKEASMFSVLLIKAGEIRQHGLEIIAKDEEWLRTKLQDSNFSLEDIFLGEFWKSELVLHLYDGSKKSI
ncbi:DUF421 domain-containing protein [Rosenbergiella australiborealis]|uniref:DUF421 domain-containing protein n=1 Tax=Rosenbergiella australiborealis TaxID=1544696 RepID=A0ABS5T8Q0_9GAMM|nr:DUF421 domain-containing protein [Rosenbergiella australiborealis]